MPDQIESYDVPARDMVSKAVGQGSYDCFSVDTRHDEEVSVTPKIWEGIQNPALWSIHFKSGQGTQSFRTLPGRKIGWPHGQTHPR